jgi:GNAT superfamily N-acetyltransferase
VTTSPTVVEGTLEGTALEEAVGVSIRAFQDDPFFEFLFPKDASRDRSIGILHRVVLQKVATIGVTRTALVDGHVVGVAVWIPPGRFPFPPMVQVRQLFGSIRAFLPVMGTVMRARGVLQEVVQAHTKVPHWYLQLLMVDPAFQRQGIGGALQTPTLELCDSSALPAWLETQKEENLAYYGRFGFSVVGEHRAPDGPSIWSLNRDPKG